MWGLLWPLAGAAALYLGMRAWDTRRTRRRMQRAEDELRAIIRDETGRERP